MVMLVSHELWCVQAGAAAVPAYEWPREVCLGRRRGSWHAYSPSVPSLRVGAGRRERREEYLYTTQRVPWGEGAWIKFSDFARVINDAVNTVGRGTVPRLIAVEFVVCTVAL